MTHKFPRGSYVRIIKLDKYDSLTKPELKIGDVGMVFGTNDYFPEIIVIDFNGKLYNMELEQLEAAIDPEIEPAVKAAEKLSNDLYNDVGKALNNMPKKED